MAKVARRSDQPVRVQRLSDRNKQLMLAVLLRNPKAFKDVLSVVQREHFDRFGPGYGLIWDAVAAHYKQYNGLPDFELLAAEIDSLMEQDRRGMTEIEITNMNDFLSFAFGSESFSRPVETDEAYYNWTMKTVRQFVTENVLIDTREQMITESSIPVNIPQLLEATQRNIQNAEQLLVVSDEESFPSGWDQSVSTEISSTGLSFLDIFLGGGQAPGEVYGLLGPYGSCKSTISYMLAVEQAKMYYNEALLNPDAPKKVVYVFSYEDRLPEMRQRVMGYAATVLRDYMQSMKSKSDLSKAGQLRDYEKQLFRNEIGSMGINNVPGELERVNQAELVLNKHLKLMDMTGFSIQGAGGGGVPEIANMIDAHLTRTKSVCGCVLIDYVGAAVKRLISMSDRSLDEMRHLIGGFPLDMKNRVCDTFNTPTWLMHQLSGSANSVVTAVVADHTDAAEAKNFAENLYFSFQISRIVDGNLAAIACSKHRRTQHKDNRVIRVKGDIYRVEDVSHMYRVNPETNRIENTRDAEMIVNTVDVAAAAQLPIAVNPERADAVF